MKKNFFIKRIKKNLIIGFTKRAGKNYFGRKTIFTQSGGVKKKLRLINFKRTLNYNSILLTIEKDINRTGYIGLVYYENGLYSYILLSNDLNKIGNLVYGFNNKFLLNSSMFLLNVFIGNFIHHIELIPYKGAQLVRAAGCSSLIISKEEKFFYIKMNSKWLLKLSKFCLVVTGIVSNVENKLIDKKKAGINRNLGWRPKVRGVAMNPCDHPHGGGEGKGAKPVAPKTAWGKLIKTPTKRTKIYLKKKLLYKKI